jgi:hypothetical protein
MGWWLKAPSPRGVALLAGLLYVGEGATSVFGQLIVPGSLLISGDPTRTAAHILENETLLRLGVAATVLSVVFFIAETAAFASLFGPIGRGPVQLFVFFSITAIGLNAVAALFEMAPLTVLRSRDLAALGDEQRAAFAVLFMRLSAQTMNIFLILFGFRCIALGYLVLRSSFMPHLIGGLLVLAGVAYLPNLWPPLEAAITPFNLVLAFGELVLVVWLLARGVDNARWRAQAAATDHGAFASA